MSNYSPLPASAVSTTAPSLTGRPPGYQLMIQAVAERERAFPQSKFRQFVGADPLSADGRAWYAGALGEQEVARNLDALGPEWTILHSVRVGKGDSDIDHIVIGPPGVFTINTKNHRNAKVWVSPKLMLVNGQKTDTLRNAKFESTRASELISTAIGQPITVRPIVAVAGASQLTIREKPVDFLVVRANALVRSLKRMRSVFTTQQVAIISAAAANPRTWKHADLPGVDPAAISAFARLHAEVVTAKNHRDIFSFLIVLAAAIGVVSLLWIVLGQVVNSLSTNTSVDSAFSVATWWPLIALSTLTVLIWMLGPRRRR